MHKKVICHKINRFSIPLIKMVLCSYLTLSIYLLEWKKMRRTCTIERIVCFPMHDNTLSVNSFARFIQLKFYNMKKVELKFKDIKPNLPTNIKCCFGWDWLTFGCNYSMLPLNRCAFGITSSARVHYLLPLGALPS